MAQPMLHINRVEVQKGTTENKNMQKSQVIAKKKKDVNLMPHLEMCGLKLIPPSTVS